MDLLNKSTDEILDAEPVISVKDTKEIFETNLRKWTESEQCKDLRSILVSVKITANVQRIVAFACASISSDTKQKVPCSSFQHALALTLREVLGTNQEDTDEISCFAQDPAYSESDKKVLKEYGISVVDNPEGFLKVDSSTIVISCAPQAPVKQIISDIALPAAMIWDRVEECDRDDFLW